MQATPTGAEDQPRGAGDGPRRVRGGPLEAWRRSGHRERTTACGRSRGDAGVNTGPAPSAGPSDTVARVRCVQSERSADSSELFLGREGGRGGRRARGPGAARPPVTGQSRLGVSRAWACLAPSHGGGDARRRAAGRGTPARAPVTTRPQPASESLRRSRRLRCPVGPLRSGAAAPAYARAGAARGHKAAEGNPP